MDRKTDLQRYMDEQRAIFDEIDVRESEDSLVESFVQKLSGLLSVCESELAFDFSRAILRSKGLDSGTAARLARRVARGLQRLLPRTDPIPRNAKPPDRRPQTVAALLGP